MGKGSILVVGGGIGGLSAAIAFCDKGFDVTVAELREDLHSSVFGVGIIQPFNALRALDAIGCAQACMDIGFSTEVWGRALDVDGNETRQIPGARIPDSNLPPMNGITRPKLHEILTRRVREVGAEIRYNCTFETLEQTPENVVVTFNDGTVETFDFVIGADGMYSKTRAHVLEVDIKPSYNGQSAFRVNIPREIPGYGLIDRIILQHSKRGMSGFVPIGKDLAYMWYNSEWPEGTRLNPAEMATALRERLSHYGGLTAIVRDNFIPDDAEIVFRPIDWLIAPAPWHKGRIALLGDAVHAFLPHLGQGAAQAIEDGVVLAECLADSPDDHEGALNRYVERRYERCRMVIQGCVDIGEWEKGNLPDFDNIAVTQHIIETLVQPI
jgi:2-polyprenyl-6-methoxyphenol hydroxylase-like FAD-dependent oxidoreductase